MQVLMNNVKVVGIFIIINLILMMPLGRIIVFLEKDKSNIPVYSIIVTLFIFALYFGLSRFLIRGTGILFYDFLSLVAIIAIYVLGLLFLPKDISYYLYFQHYLFMIFFKNQYIGIIIPIVMSILAVFLGIISKSGIIQIF